MNFWDQQGGNQYQQYQYTQDQTSSPNHHQGVQQQQQQYAANANPYQQSQYTAASFHSLQPPPPPQQQQQMHAYGHDQYTTMLSSLHQQTQQRQALGASAAASISSLLKRPSMATAGYQQQQQQQLQQQMYQAPPYPSPVNAMLPDQRGVVPYGDIYGESTQAGNKQKPVKEEEESGGSCCLRYYKTKKALVQHQKEHVHCTQCPNFTGVRQLLQDHMETVHGAAKKNKKNTPDGVVPSNAPRLDTPEAIAKWIEERKKNWPSQVNVERKKQLEKEREARGELPKNNNKRKTQPSTPNDKKPNKKARTPLPSNSLVNYASDSDQEYVSANEEFDVTNNKKEEEEEEEDTMNLETDAISSKDPTSMGKVATPTAGRPRKICKYNMRGKCRRGDACLYSHEKSANRNNQQTKGKQRESDQFRKRPHLLKMLLSKEIRQEQNAILQCLRYIKENDFFGLGNTD